MVKRIYLLNRLINQEFPRAYKRIVSRLEGEEFAVVDVQQSFDSFKTRVQQLDYIKSNVRLHELSETIANQRDLRHQHLLSLKGRVTYCLKSPIANERVAAKTLSVWLKREREFLTFKNIERQSQSVYRMQHDITLNVKFGEALEALSMLSVMDSLVSVTTEIDEHVATREADIEAENKKAKELRYNAYFALRTFITSVEQAIILKKGIIPVHLGYLDRIDKIVTEFNAAHASRITRQRNLAAEAEANKEANPENGATTGGGVQQMGGKPAMAGRSKTFNVMTGNGTDLQKGGATNTLAMDGSVTNGGATNGADKKIIDLSAGNGGMLIDDFESLTKEPTQGKHNGAQVNDSSDQES